MVRQAQASRSRARKTSPTVRRGWLTYIALIAGFGSLGFWLLAGQPYEFAVERHGDRDGHRVFRMRSGLPCRWSSPSATTLSARKTAC